MMFGDEVRRGWGDEMKEGVISISNVVVPCEAHFLVGSIINSVGVCVCAI